MKRVDEVTQHGGRHQQAYGERGTLKTEPVKFLVKDDAQPYAVHTARRVPLPMLQKVKEELQRMERNGVIADALRNSSFSNHDGQLQAGHGNG